MWVRHCARCGHLDLRTRYETREQAEMEELVEAAWLCPRCNNAEFTLAETPADTAHLPERSR